jgi:transposase
VRAAYPAGPEAVVAVVRAAVGALRAEVTTLRTEVAELRRQLAAGSTTSSKPPSTDLSRAGRRVVSLRRPSGRPAGGQPGHAGRTLEWRRPDVVVCHVPERCAGCGRALGRPGAAPADGARGGALGVRLLERAQVIDLPPVTLTVTAHERVAVTCRHCGVESGAAFPGGVRAGVQYGPGVRAFAVALHSYHLLPYARTAECLDGLLGTGPSPGSITRWVAQAARALAPAAETARDAVRAAYAAHADETCLHVAGRRRWLHVAATATHTHYHIDERRGLSGIDAGGVWGRFRGVMVHDGWWSYGRYGEARHQLCLVHLQREARGLFQFTEEAGRPERWLAEIDALLGRLHRLVRRAAAAGRAALAPRTVGRIAAAYDGILRRARRRHPYPQQGRDNLRPGRPKRGVVAAFADRLIKYRTEVLRCAGDARVPPDNNQAERDLRMAKLADKISGGFRTMEGARQFCLLRSALATARKHGQSALTMLRDVFAAALSPELNTAR